MSEPTPKLYRVEDCDSLSLEDTQDLYRKFVSSSQVEAISAFGFGRELVDYAEGSWFYLRNGRKILDFTGGFGVLNHGHNHPRILKVRKEFQDRKKLEVHKSFFSPYLAALSHNIAQLLPGDLNVSYLPNSGGESVEGALKMAYKYHQGKRHCVLHADISFHGKLIGSGSVTGSRETPYEFQKIPHVETFCYDDLESVREKVGSLRNNKGSSDVYALIVEPFSASSLRENSEEFLRGVREICTEEKIVLIFDEVYTGWGKTGELFHFMRHEGLVPDILTSSKSFGGGKASISLYVARDPIFRKAYDNLSDFTLHSTTYNAFGEESITALEAVNIVMEDDYPAKARHIEERLGAGLRHLKEKHPKMLQEVLGVGALQGIMINPGSKVLQAVTQAVPVGMFRDKQFLNKLTTCAVIAELYAAHGILTSFGANDRIVLWIAPALIVTDEEIDHFLDALDKTLNNGLLALVLKLLKSKIFQR